MSLRSIDLVLLQHSADIQALRIPNIAEYVQLLAHVASSPYVDQFKLRQIKTELNRIRHKVATEHANDRTHTDTLKQVDTLLSSVDEKEFVLCKLTAAYTAQYQQELQRDTEPEAIDNTNEAEPVAEDDLTSLRQRLLSGGQHTQHLDESLNNTDSLNEYHESVQENILNDLTELTSTLKNSAIALSSKILNDDFQILNETNENIIKNSSMFKLIDRNLNSYLENKSGGKISLFFLIKVTAALIVTFLVMIIFVKIIPKIG
ncbi:uncharacterized protein CANTADRAFT_87865 [Suhomyces tanzawaensis NRRL Y-17324]|uniref:Uncharacterized protein n=1 Tax=Suhomyces tanzawaensis NRRL Y-17324 TaxID=984487 RepID=A0A1E4SQW0_9ASCO|nr:uncharacterized protein CANTADRAFT_87865 [Suhomyces tanzawaensis NRRL Y-17324]ODV81906.1 hypothetical protein CANTADRAFT_87865 [Suhomyces tanzawaensis NRRL Y-17324]